MLKTLMVATAALLILGNTAEARRHSYNAQTAQQFCGTRYCQMSVVEVQPIRGWDYRAGHRYAGKPKSVRRHAKSRRHFRGNDYTGRVPRHARSRTVRHNAIAEIASTVTRTVTQILPHPDGCPRTAFCGCGTAVHIFGKPIRELWLAANWFKFPASTPGPGKVAVRRHHVFAILKDLGNGKVLAYDPNSGRHQTKIHVRSLAGYSVRDPGGKTRWAYAG